MFQKGQRQIGRPLRFALGGLQPTRQCSRPLRALAVGQNRAHADLGLQTMVEQQQSHAVHAGHPVIDAARSATLRAQALASA